MKNALRFTIILAAVFGFASVSTAQDEKTISAEKKRLIAELIVLTKADQQMAELTDKTLESMETVYPLIVDGVIQRTPDLPAEEKEALKEQMLALNRSFSEKFRRRLLAEFDFGQYVEDSIYPLYDQFYTEKELADLVAFYRTETGQKVIATMPQLFAESLKLSQQYLVPKVSDLIDRIMTEELEALKNGPPPPRKH